MCVWRDILFIPFPMKPYLDIILLVITNECEGDMCMRESKLRNGDLKMSQRKYFYSAFLHQRSSYNRLVYL